MLDHLLHVPLRTAQEPTHELVNHHQGDCEFRPLTATHLNVHVRSGPRLVEFVAAREILVDSRGQMQVWRRGERQHCDTVIIIVSHSSATATNLMAIDGLAVVIVGRGGI